MENVGLHTLSDTPSWEQISFISVVLPAPILPKKAKNLSPGNDSNNSVAIFGSSVLLLQIASIIFLVSTYYYDIYLTQKCVKRFHYLNIFVEKSNKCKKNITKELVWNVFGICILIKIKNNK